MGPLRLIWHAERMPLSEVKQKHVWLLSEMMAMPSGDYGVHHRTRAPRRTPTTEELDAQIEALKEANVEMVWVTRKYPIIGIFNSCIVTLVSAWRSNGVVHATYWSLRSVTLSLNVLWTKSLVTAFPARCGSPSISRIATHAYLAS